MDGVNNEWTKKEQYCECMQVWSQREGKYEQRQKIEEEWKWKLNNKFKRKLVHWLVAN